MVKINGSAVVKLSTADVRLRRDRGTRGDLGIVVLRGRWNEVGDVKSDSGER